MKVITVTEPWATLVVIGAKKYETRSWARPAQGRLLVHAAKGMPRYALNAVLERGQIQTTLCEHFGDSQTGVLDRLNDRRGKIIGSVAHVGCFRTEDVRDMAIFSRERAFGDFSDNRFAWGLHHPRAFKTFVPVRGSLGIWTLPEELVANMLAEVLAADEAEAAALPTITADTNG